jgi:hypothetical protein
MKRRVRGIEFAEVWGKVCRWAEKDRADLVQLLSGIAATPPTEGKERKPRKPREKGVDTDESRI